VSPFAGAFWPLPSFDDVRVWQAQKLFDRDGNFLAGAPPGVSVNGSSTGDGSTLDPYGSCAASGGSGASTGSDLATAECVAIVVDLMGTCSTLSRGWCSCDAPHKCAHTGCRCKGGR
jgi:hypothetical protein